MRDRVRELLARWAATVVDGLAVAGHGQWGSSWFPVDDVEELPGPGELSWARFEEELHALLDAARGDGVGGARPGGEPQP